MSGHSEYSEKAPHSPQTNDATASPEALTIRSLEWRAVWLGIGLGAVTLLLVLVGVGALLLFSQQQNDRKVEAAKRAAEVEHEAAVAANEARDLFDQQARPLADRPELWQPVIGRADDTLKRAENVLKVGDAKPETRERVEALRSELDQAKKGLDLANQLDALRLRRPDASVSPQQAKDAADAYALLFKEHGVDVRILDAPLSVKKLQVFQNRDLLLDGILDWADVTPNKDERGKLWEVVSSGNTDPGSLQVQTVRAKMKDDRPALIELYRSEMSNSADPPPRPAWAYRRLADALYAAAAKTEAVELLRKYQSAYPQDFWLNYTLGALLLQDNAPKDRADALRFLTAAAALRSPSAPLYNHLGLALRANGEVGEAIKAYEIARRAESNNVAVLNNLGTARLQNGEVDTALDLFETAVKIDPKRIESKINFGSALRDKGSLDLAIRAFNDALEIDKNSAIALTNLGKTLEAKGDLDGAVDAHLKALKIDPKSITAHNNLGNAQLAKGDLDDALHTFQDALVIDPRHAPTHINLGAAWQYKGDLDAAARAFQTATELAPRDALPHEHLAFVLALKGDLTGAIREYRTAVDFNPRSVVAYLGLAKVLVEKGQLTEAVALLNDGVKRVDEKNNLRVKQQYEEYKSWVQKNDHLDDVLFDRERLNSAEEMIAYGRLCQFYKHMYNNAVKFYADAFGIRPEIANDLRMGHRFDAACAAVLAGSGQGEDVASFTDLDRQSRRQQARRWLGDDLALWTKLAASDKPADRAQVRTAMLRWRQERALNAVRGKEALLKLSEPERAAWQKLWDDVDALLEQLRHKKV